MGEEKCATWWPQLTEEGERVEDESEELVMLRDVGQYQQHSVGRYSRVDTWRMTHKPGYLFVPPWICYNCTFKGLRLCSKPFLENFWYMPNNLDLYQTLQSINFGSFLISHPSACTFILLSPLNSSAHNLFSMFFSITPVEPRDPVIERVYDNIAAPIEKILGITFSIFYGIRLRQARISYSSLFSLLLEVLGLFLFLPTALHNKDGAYRHISSPGWTHTPLP